MNTWFCTAFGQVRLSDKFVHEAEEMHPGFFRQSLLWSPGAYQEPRWVTKLHGAIEQLMQDAYSQGITIRELKSAKLLSLQKSDRGR